MLVMMFVFMMMLMLVFVRATFTMIMFMRMCHIFAFISFSAAKIRHIFCNLVAKFKILLSEVNNYLKSLMEIHNYKK